MARITTGTCRVESAMVARNGLTRKRLAASEIPFSAGRVVGRSDVAGSVQAEQSLGAMLGSPGRTGPAHVMQFRPIWLEGPVEELAPERLELGNRAGPIVAADGGGRKRGRCEGAHDADSLFSARLLPRAAPFQRRKSSFRLIY